MLNQKLSDNLANVKSGLPAYVKLLAVSKTHPPEAVNTLFEAGQTDFGENKVQELNLKQEQLPATLNWHMIGHLQRNKVKFIAPYVKLIQSVDSLRLLKEINKQAQKNNRQIDVLLQIHIAKEENKFGFDISELEKLLASPDLSICKNINICGLMGMATFTDNSKQVAAEFGSVRVLFDELKKNHFKSISEFNILSMGMSHDYKIAIDKGSTMVRIGSAIFGARH